MGKKTSRRAITIRAYRFARLAHRKRRRYFFDVAMLIAASGLILCEFAFPLADKDISTQSAPSLIALRSIALPSSAAMERYLEARDDFYKRTMNHTRDPLSISVDAYKLLSLQLQYLSYFSTATPLLLDELDTIQLLDRFGKGNLAESSPGRRMTSALKSLIGLRPILTQCISDVNEKRHSIEQVLDDTSGRNLAVELDIVTLNALPDLLKDRHSRWRQCQESLSDFDKQMTTLAVTYPVINQELAKQAARQKTARTMLRWFCNLLLCACALHRSRWASVISDVFGK